MQVGVEPAQHEHLPHEDGRPVDRQIVPCHTSALGVAHLGEAPSVHELAREHPPCRERPRDSRHDHEIVASKVEPEPVGHPPLVSQIDLAQQGRRELVEEPRQVQPIDALEPAHAGDQPTSLGDVGEYRLSPRRDARP